MDETMMNTMEDLAEDTVMEVKPTLNKGAVVGLTALVTGIIGFCIYKGVKAYKRHKANVATEAEMAECSEESDVE